MDNQFGEFRKGLTFLSEGIFLNYAATAPVTTKTTQAIHQAVDMMNEPLGKHFYSALNQLEFTRREFAQLINADASEIAFTQNTSSALSLVAMSLNFQPGDKILVPADEFPSNYYPWLNLKSKSVTCEKFHLDPKVPIVETLKKMNLKDVRLISISAVSFQTGRSHDLQAFAEFCRENNIFSCLDAIQAIGAIKVDVKQIGCDFLCTGAQKWILGPVGCGILYANKKHLSKMGVPYVGWTSVLYPEYMDLGPLEFAEDMTRFEPGLPNFFPVVGTHSSLVELKALGWNNIYAAIRKNTTYLHDELRHLGLSLLNEDLEHSAGITSFYFNQPQDHRIVESKYHDLKMKITARKDYVRVSPHFFNTKPEIDQFLEATKRVFSLRKEYSKADSGLTKESETNPQAGNSDDVQEKILIIGACGNLGRELCVEFARRDFHLFLVDQSTDLATLTQELRAKFNSIKISHAHLNLDEPKQIQDFINAVKSSGEKFHGLVNCAGIISAALFTELEDPERLKIMQVNFTAQTQIMRQFLLHLGSAKMRGVLNIVSSTGRCGSPLLADYGAANAAFWTLSETVGRELPHKVLTFVAPAMHSPMQKRIGRTALRYFQFGGSFEYETAEHVAKEAVDHFLEGKEVYISKLSRLKIFANSIWPEKVTAKIRKSWYEKT